MVFELAFMLAILHRSVYLGDYTDLFT